MNSYAALSLVAIIFNLLLGIFVISRDPGRRLNRLFLGIMGTLIVWGIGEFIMRVAGSEATADLGSKIAGFGWCLLGPVFVTFALEYAGQVEAVKKPLTLALLYTPGIFFLVLVWTTNLIFEGFERTYWGYVDIRGPLRIPSQLYVVVFTMLGIAILFRTWRRASSQRKRTGAFWVMVAAAIPLLGGIVTDVVLPIAGKKVVEMPMLATTVAAPLIAYAVTTSGVMTSIASTLGSTIVKTIEDAVVLVDAEGCIEKSNRACTELSGYSEKQLMGMPLDRLLVADEAEAGNHGSLDHGTGPPTVRFCVKADGERVPVSVSTGEVVSRTGRAIGSVVVLHDLSETMELLLARDRARAADEEARIEKRYARQLLRTVSELEEAEAELKSEKSFIENALNALDDFFVVFDFEGNMLRWNDRVNEASGLTDEQISSTKAVDFFGKSNVERARDGISKIIKDGHHSIMLTGRGPDGDAITYELHGSLLRDREGNPVAICGIGRDVTEHMKADEAIYRSEEYYRSLMKASPDAVTVSDLEGNIIETNLRALELYGADSKEELVGKSAFELIAPESRERAAENLHRTLDEGVTRDIEYTLVRKDGSRYQAELSASLIRDPDGNPMAFTALVRDVSERKRAEERIELLSEGVESSFSGIAISDADMNLTYVNRSFCDMWGGDPAQHVGRNAFDYWDDDSRRTIEDELLPALEERGWHGELNGLRSNGERFPVNAIASSITDDEGEVIYMMGIFEDISERRRVEQMKTDFLTTAAHELRTPLTAMELSVDTLVSGIGGKLTGRQRRITDRLTEAIDHMSQLANRFLDIADIEARRVSLERERVDVSMMVRMVADSLRNAARSKGLTMDIRGLEDPVYAAVDQDRMSRVLYSLIDNAIKFTDEGSITLTASSGGDGEAEVSVEDEGMGIPGDIVNTVFDKFSRAHMETDTRKSGSGLSLAIAKGIVELHGGSITVESEEGKGSKFTVRIPVEAQ